MVTTKPARTVTHDEAILYGETIISGTHIPVLSVYLMAKSYRGDLAAVQHALSTLSMEDIALALRYEQDHPMRSHIGYSMTSPMTMILCSRHD